ncbi:hypothetical protein ASPZODRAFT_148117 [Penicilliopsis zonata CBS 506.65]|uniref:CN hydrolase domain-containing protein n=1 Tax=Penicilliopsis zonata CBS 506.65 TaxID=1073090 RepID=A0A1L9STX6_9EURO|nr:hypothetical protein ASPZODRAFT_148117 [Penicilliopsis zonata CBS 506.65]OJJ50649.1 hypothetical protein ASPZODRAFT_148117 [Penicilliopsis zonata CBS 506.65]
MPRVVRLAAAQMGTTNKWDTREQTMQRMIKLLVDAAGQGAQVVLFPEIAFTTFFPRYLILDEQEIESWFEHGDVTTAPNTKPLFDEAHKLGVDICVGFAENTPENDHYNSCVYYHAKTGSVLAKYRKIHLPGDAEPLPDPKAINQLEKRYFKPGNLGWQAFRVPELTSSLSSSSSSAPPDERGDPIFGMMICNDRRWAESWRVLGLQGVEVVLCGYNTNGYAPELWGVSAATLGRKEAEELSLFHHQLVMQANSYTNATFSVCAARCGLDDGQFPLIAGSMIIDPEGRILAQSSTTADELVIADCDLELCRPGKQRTFDFARHRRIEHYQPIATQTGVIEPSRDTDARSVEKKEPVLKGDTVREIKKIRVLLCNPNTTQSMTDACVQSVQASLPADVEVHGLTASAPAPTAVEGHFDAVMSAASAVRAILPLADRYDAFLVACYSDHPLIRMLREEVDQPVVGIMEASLIAARTLGNRFGVVAVSARSRVMHEDAIRHYGLTSFFVGVGSCDIGVLDLACHNDTTNTGIKVVESIVADVAASLVDQGADTLTLGCAGMTTLKTAVEKRVGPKVQVVDGVVAGVHHLVGLVRMGCKTAKAGMYMSSRAKRIARGQEYY